MKKINKDVMIAALSIFVATFSGLMIGLTLMAGHHLYELGRPLEGLAVMCMPAMSLVLLMIADCVIDWAYDRGIIKKTRKGEAKG